MMSKQIEQLKAENERYKKYLTAFANTEKTEEMNCEEYITKLDSKYNHMINLAKEALNKENS